MKTYIQIGANVGDDDFFRKIEESSEQLTIHLIEPNLSLHEKLIKCYDRLNDIHDIHIHGFGISTVDGKAALNLYGNSGLSSLIDRKSYNWKQSELEIDCITFNNFCNQFNISKIDYLSIDTEGLDYEILNSIDLKLVDIKEIVFEWWSYEDDDMQNKYRTGVNFLENVVLPKYTNYDRSEIILDGMRTIKLNQNVNRL